MRPGESCKCVKVARNSPQIDGEAARKRSGTRGTACSDGGRKEEEDTHIKRIIRLAVDCVGGRTD